MSKPTSPKKAKRKLNELERWGERYRDECMARDSAILDARDALQTRLPFVILQRECEVFSEYNPDATVDSVIDSTSLYAGWDQAIWQGGTIVGVILNRGKKATVYRFADDGTLLPEPRD